MDAFADKPDAARILDVVQGSEMFARAEADRLAKLKVERAAQVAQLRKLEKDAARDFPPVFAEAEAAEQELRAARTAVNRVAIVTATEKLSAILGRRFAMSLAFSGAHDQLEADLRTTADPRIAAFLHELGHLHELAMRKLPNSRDRYVPMVSPVTGKITTRIETNPDQLTSGDAIEAVLAARHDAEALLYVADQSVVPAELARLRKTLPQQLLALAAPK